MEKQQKRDERRACAQPPATALGRGGLLPLTDYRFIGIMIIYKNNLYKKIKARYCKNYNN